ncbi:MAG: PSD1 domain-containing protein [Planctomycetes bacterium]|nr:PSD1 domain-containing protein [Planctomycetota bacterium]
MGIEFFEKKIRPVLVENCYQCHSDEAQRRKKLKGGLRLDSAAGIRSGGDSGPLFVLDKPGDSPLIKALRHDGLKMPPDSRLAEGIIADFEHWVKLGAPLPASGGTAAEVRQMDWPAARQAWPFRVPVEHPAPTVQKSDWPKSIIDAFVLAGLESRGLQPVPPAGRRELIRRATLDLIGLPPTPQEVTDFLNDTSPQAFATVVDRLLQSPHYGERWARYWLDLARYADDQGNSFLSPTPQAYLYRDWVVRAFNRDLSYDEFIRLQVAGDELPEGAADYVERLAGLGFQGLGPQFRKGAAGEEKARADELEDRLDTLSRGLLGLTVSCARCHDHKFDPIPTRDYYSLAAAYNGASWGDRMLASPETVTRRREWEQQVQQQRTELEKWTAEQCRLTGRRALEQVDAYLIAAWRLRTAQQQKQTVDEAAMAKHAGLQLQFLNRLAKAIDAAKDGEPLHTWRLVAETCAASDVVPEKLSQQTQSLKDSVVTALGKQDAKTALAPSEESLLKTVWQTETAPFFVSPKDVPGILTADSRDEYTRRQGAVDQLVNAPAPAGPMMPSVSGGGVALKVFVRGNPLQLGEPAPPGFLRILGGQAQPTERFTRLDLANAIASPENPLTARVLVNRVWHYHFGRGIVASLGNFGKQGTPPTHPELLDTMAARFMKSGWSLKALHREIMLSATYQLSTARDATNEAIDPDNHFLWRATPRRLDFEAWRDSILAVSGKLDPTVGGPALDPTTPAVKEVPGADFYTRLVGLELDNPHNGRRTLYSIVSRYSLNPTAGLFDVPEPNVASDLRPVTTIPQQQLFVLNSQFVIAMSRAFAERLSPSADDPQRLQLAWELAYGRPPTEVERKLALDFLQSAGTTDLDKLGRWEQLCHALLSSNEFAFLP